MYAAGGTGNGFLVRYDEQGAIQWQRRIGPYDKGGYVADLACTDDGGVIVSLEVQDGGTRAYLARFNASGTLLWSIEPAPSTGSIDSLILARSPDGTFLAAQKLDTTTTWIGRLNDAGSILWSKEISSCFPFRMAATPEGGAAIFSIISTLQFPGLLRVDRDGNVISHKKLPENGYITSGSIGVHPDGSAIPVWSTGGSLDQTLAGRFDNRGGTASGCANETVEFLSLVTPVPAVPAIPTLPTTNWFGITTGLSSSLSGGLVTTSLYCGDPCAPMTYCETTPNSSGAGATIGYSGSTSMSANDLTLIASELGPNKAGLFFYSSEPAAKPFGNGTLCVGGQKTRLPVQTSDASGVLSFDVDLNQMPSHGGVITLGSTWYFQCWYRDPQGGGNGTNLSDGLAHGVPSVRPLRRRTGRPGTCPPRRSPS